MKRFINTGLLLLATIFMVVVAWFYGWKPAIEGVTEFLRTEATPRKVTIPLGGREYVDIYVDGINSVLEETNQLTLWRFNDNRVVRTKEHLDGKPLSGPVNYMSNREVYRQYNDYYVSVASDNRYVGVSKDSLMKASVYTAPCPKMDENNQILELPDVSLPTEYKEEEGWNLPVDVEGMILSRSKDDMSYHKGAWYFNYNFRYQKQWDAITDAATRVCALSGQNLDWWYLSGNTFIAKAGNEYACVKQDTYTSCYFISSNDLAYILLNL